MISVIIPTTTGGLSYISQLLPTVAHQDIEKEIIIIDNDSRDGTTNFLMNYECTLKINKTKMNFSQSNNYGAGIAKGDHLLFINNDTKLNDGLLQTMLETFSINENIGVVGTLLLLMDTPKRVQHAGVCFTDKYEPYELGLPLPFGISELPFDDPKTHAIREVPSVTAACMMVKKEVFYKVGGFDENYVFGWEDTDFNLKAREQGYKIWYNGTNYAYHKHFGSKDRGRFLFESRNRQRYEEVWMNTGRAKEALNGFTRG